MNGEIVEYNKLRMHPHGSNVFVIKVQLWYPEADQCRIYDSLRNITLRLFLEEVGARKDAFANLRELALAEGVLFNGVKKVYLYSQYAGDCLRVFSSCLPQQTQSF